MSAEYKKYDIYSMIRKLRDKKTIYYTVIIFPVFLVILIYMAFMAYNNDKNTIIAQQEQQMLTIARSTCENVKIFFEEKASSLKIIAGNQGVIQSMAGLDPSGIQQAFEAYYKAKRETVQRLYQVDKTGEIVYAYPGMEAKEAEETRSMFYEEIQKVMIERKSRIGSAKKEQTGNFLVNIYEPVFSNGQFVGMLISSVDLNAVYERLVKPVKVGQKGYVMVKDSDGIILMHPVKEQVGIDVIDTRKQLYPGFDFKDLEKLVDMQMSRGEGTMAYYSYWWTDKVLERSKKLNAFSRVYLEDFYWIVAVTMDYDELEGPISQNRIKTIEIFIMIILILLITVFTIMKIQRNKEALEVETKYLRELNAASEELRKKDLQLQHSQKLQVIGTLTGGIAHEFNNLLTPIQGYSEIIMSKVDPKDEIYNYTNEIYEASGKAKDIIEQIMVYSRSDSRKSKHVPVQVAALLEETLNLVKSTITTNVDLVFEKKDDQGVILANKVQVHQVVLNLCNNSYHAMKYTGGVLKVTVENIPLEEVKKHYHNIQEASYFVKITVSDTGYGMNKETVSKIFDPFFTTKPVGEGTGLGLFIVHGIVENHKGIITVESEIGKGSTFSVYFPGVLHNKVQEAHKERQVRSGDLKTVLMIDDKQKVLNVMKKSLEPFSFKVHLESNSVEALKVFEENPARFDVVITDQSMPYIKGLELAERMKALNPMVKILLVTGFAEEKVLEYKERLIIDDYMYKPVTGSDMAEVIRRILQS